MSIEQKRIEVLSSKETDTLAFWRNFGWTSVASEKIYSGATLLHIKHSLERDTDGSEYARLRALEKEYFACEEAAQIADKTLSSIKSEWEQIPEYNDFRPPEIKEAKRRMIPLSIGTLSVCIFFTILGGALSLSPLLLIFGVGMVASIYWVIFALIDYYYLSKARSISKAQEEPDSPCGKIYQAEFETYLTRRHPNWRSKEQLEARMAEILAETESRN